MSELAIDLYSGLKVVVSDCAGGDPHVIIEGREGHVRVNATDVGRLADVLTGASVMMEADPGPLQSNWRGTGGYPIEKGDHRDD